MFCSVHIVLKKSCTLREEHGQRVLRKILGPKKDVTREWQDCIIRSCMIYTPHLYWGDQIMNEMDGHVACMGDRRSPYKGLVWRVLWEERSERVMLKWISKKWDG